MAKTVKHTTKGGPEAEPWWKQADEMRDRAASIADEKIKRGLLKIAEEYEALAELSDEISAKMLRIKALLKAYDL